MIVFDSYAWFEYFFGTSKGQKVRGYIDNSKEIIVTPAHVFYEVKNKLIRENKPFNDWIRFMSERSLSEPFTATIAINAVDVRLKYSLKTSDAFIYATAMEKKSKLLTGDQQLKNLPQVEFLN